MSDSESQEKGSSSENADPENATEHTETWGDHWAI